MSARPGSMRHQMKCGPSDWSACENAASKSCGVLVSAALSMPAARANAAKFIRAELTVGVPPDDSYTPLSIQIWTRLRGCFQPIEPRLLMFIQSAPSPSSTITLLFDWPSARPMPIDEHRPSVLTCKFASLGWMACHSPVAPPAVVTTSSSWTSPLIASSASTRFIVQLLQHSSGDEEGHRSLRGFRHGHRATDLLGEGIGVAEDLVLDIERLEHRLGDEPEHVEGVVTPIARVVDQEQQGDAEL